MASKLTPEMYRLEKLKDAHVHINKLQNHEWPPHIRALADFLTHDDFASVLQESQASTLAGPEQARRRPWSIIQGGDKQPPSEGLPALNEAIGLKTAVHLYEGRPKEDWMSLASRVFAVCIDSTLLQHRTFAAWGDGQIFKIQDVEVPTPKPSFTFGLRLDDDKSLGGKCTGEAIDSATIKVISELAADLRNESLPSRLTTAGIKQLWSRHFIEGNPFDDRPLMAFPPIIYYATSDVSSIFVAENKAAATAAIAIATMNRMQLAFDIAQHDLPVLVVCSSGLHWKFYVAFTQDLLGATKEKVETHLVRVWQGSLDDPWSLFQLEFMLRRGLVWIEQVFKPIVNNFMAELVL